MNIHIKCEYQSKSSFATISFDANLIKKKMFSPTKLFRIIEERSWTYVHRW